MGKVEMENEEVDKAEMVGAMIDGAEMEQLEQLKQVQHLLGQRPHLRVSHLLLFSPAI